MIPQSDTSAMREALTAVLKSGDIPLPLVCADSNQGQVRFYAADPGAAAKLRQEAEAALRSAGIEARVTVESANRSWLMRPRSLDALIRGIADDSIIHDPTAVFGRARALVVAAATARMVLGGKVDGIFLDPSARILFVTIPANRNLTELLQSCRHVVGMFDEAIEAAAQASGGIQINRPPIRVRAVTDLPNSALVPVDRQSAKLARRIGSKMRRRLTLMAAAIGLGTVPTVAFAIPAVNPQLGELTSASQAAGTTGSAIDNAMRHGIDDLYTSTAGQLFWRDPNKDATAAGAMPGRTGDKMGSGDLHFERGLIALPGLSVFFDGATNARNLNFAAMGFGYYFGAALNVTVNQDGVIGVQFAQNRPVRPPRGVDDDMGSPGFGTSSGSPSS